MQPLPDVTATAYDAVDIYLADGDTSLDVEDVRTLAGMIALSYLKQAGMTQKDLDAEKGQGPLGMWRTTFITLFTTHFFERRDAPDT